MIFVTIFGTLVGLGFQPSLYAMSSLVPSQGFINALIYSKLYVPLLGWLDKAYNKVVSVCCPCLCNSRNDQGTSTTKASKTTDATPYQSNGTHNQRPGLDSLPNTTQSITHRSEFDGSITAFPVVQADEEDHQRRTTEKVGLEY